MAVKDRLTALLRERGITQVELARRIDRDPSWVSRRLSGQFAIEADDVTALAEALDVSPALFFVQDEGELLRHGIAAELRVPLDLVGKLTYRLSGDEPKKGGRPAPIELVVGGDPARTAAVVRDALAPVIAEEVRKAVREELDHRLPERGQPEDPASTEPFEPTKQLRDVKSALEVLESLPPEEQEQVEAAWREMKKARKAAEKHE